MAEFSDEVIQWQLERMDYTRDKDGNWIDPSTIPSETRS